MTENISSISSVSASRGVSVENNSEVRGSSLSSDDGNPNLSSSPRVELTTSPKIERKDASSSPSVEKRENQTTMQKPETKLFYRKSVTKTKNTLTIQVPHLGQSLPNLNIASSSGGGGSSPNPCPPNSLLLAPPKSHGGLLSPSQRGVSYPPPSPPRGSLKRGFAISPKNPPLVKTGNVTMELSRSISVVQSSSSSSSPPPPPPPSSSSSSSIKPENQTEEKKNKTIGLQTNLDDDKSKIDTSKCDQCNCSVRRTIVKTTGKKLVRSDKRYYTEGGGGTIDDLKVKQLDSSLYKKLSFNSGNGRRSATATTGNNSNNSDSIESPPINNKHLSIASVQSSSGFSSAGSSSVEGLFTKDDVINFDSKSIKVKEEEIIERINADSNQRPRQRMENSGESFKKCRDENDKMSAKRENEEQRLEPFTHFETSTRRRRSISTTGCKRKNSLIILDEYVSSVSGDPSSNNYKLTLKHFHTVNYTTVNALQLEVRTTRSFCFPHS